MKRIYFIPRLLAAATALLLAMALALPAAAAAPGTTEAEELTAGAALAVSGGYAPGTFTDRNRSTYQSLPAGTTIEVASEAPFSHIYVIWDTPPDPWQLDVGGSTATWGQQGYLHEVITLDTPATEATLTLPDSERTLCDIYLFGEGALPGWVQQWQPILEKADLLALPTHADDEHLFFGGILPTYAGEQGLAVQVVYLTNHWGDQRYRPHELLDGLWEAGVTAYPLMGPFPDLYASKGNSSTPSPENLAAAENTFGRDNVLAFQVEILRRFQPRVVVGHDLNGEYGHGAHMLNAATLLEALPYTADEAAFPESAAQYGTWEVPKVYLHLYAENQITMDWSTPLEAFGGKTAHEVAVAAFAKHVSQSTYYTVNSASYAESGSVFENRTFGLAHSTVGTDVLGGDLFENIDLTPEPEPEPDPEPDSSPAPPDSSAVPSPPDDSLPVPGDVEPGAGMPDWVLLALPIGVVLLAVIAVIIIVAVRANKRKRRRGRHKWQPRP